MENDWLQQEILSQSVAESTAELLNTDIELGMTMARIAGDSPRGSEKRERNLRNAHKTYEDVSRMLAKTAKISTEHVEDLTRKLQGLHNMIAEVEAA